MAIGQAVIEQAKRTDLKALVEAKGIQLKKNGKGWFGLCPFHADKNPSLSINPTQNLWQCFGCGAAGDAIRFVELFDQVDFKDVTGQNPIVVFAELTVVEFKPDFGTLPN